MFYDCIASILVVVIYKRQHFQYLVTLSMSDIIIFFHGWVNGSLCSVTLICCKYILIYHFSVLELFWPMQSMSDWNHVYSCQNTSVIPFWSFFTRTCYQIYHDSLISPEVSYRNIWRLCLWKCPYTGHFLIFPHPYLLYRSRPASLTLFHVAYKYAQLPLIRGVFRAKMVNPDSTASRKHVLLLIVDTRL